MYVLYLYIYIYLTVPYFTKFSVFQFIHFIDVHWRFQLSTSQLLML